MGAIGPWQIILVLVIAVLLFGGGGRISSIMGDMAKGLKAFRSGLREEDQKDEKALDERVETARDVTPDKEDTKATD